MPTGDEHTTVHGYGAVAPLTGRTHCWSSPVVGKGACATFLRQLQRDYRAQCLMVLHDRAEQHRGAVVEAVLHAAEGRLLRLPQPADSPALHPEEHMWKWRWCVVTQNHWFETLQAERQAMRDFRCSVAGRKAVGRKCGTARTL
jgi:hypothetical protein